MDNAQVRQMVEAAEAQRQYVSQLIGEMKLRQWCVEKAIEAAPRLPADHNFGDLCEAILHFVSAPFENVFKER